jgi:hypothetical protein
MHYPITFSQNVRRCLILRTDVDKVLGNEPTVLSFEGDPIDGSSLLSILVNTLRASHPDEGMTIFWLGSFEVFLVGGEFRSSIIAGDER